MVPTGEIIVSLTFAFVWTSSTTRAGTRVINNIQGKAAISGMSGSIGDREGGVANGNTTFPGEEPSEIQLHVDPANTSARSLYESFGFERVALLPQYYSDSRDALLMRRLTASHNGNSATVLS